MANYKTVSQLAREAGLADSTVRRYIDQFGEFFDSRMEGRRRLFSADGVSKLEGIANFYSQGLTTPQVEQMLQEKYDKTIEVEEDSSFTLTTIKEREIESRERLTQVLQTIAEQKERLLELDIMDRELEQRDQKREKELRILKARLDEMERRDRRPWWCRLLKLK